jgi:hypothetical protein
VWRTSFGVAEVVPEVKYSRLRSSAGVGPDGTNVAVTSCEPSNESQPSGASAPTAMRRMPVVAASTALAVSPGR